MEIVFFSNYLNHHQIPLAEAFNALEGVNYTFVAVSKIPDFRRELGYLEYHKPYLLEIGDSEENKQKAMALSIQADVVIFLSAPLVYEYVIPRLKANKLTFEYSERWFKKRFKLNILSPRLWKYIYFYHRYGKQTNSFLLSAGAYVPNDLNMLGAYKDKCFKWGYFTKVDENFEFEAFSLDASSSESTPLMWCARFIDWKHPELPIKLAARLKKDGYKFNLDMFGGGEELEKTKRLAKQLEVEDCVHFCGNHPNEVILNEMRRHKIFLFTSDQNEGWGAVANEAMSNGCALVGANMIGAIPYLVKDGVNGLVFLSRDANSLYDQLKKLLDNPNYSETLAKQAYADMLNVWSPQSAVKRFMTLIEAINSGADTPFTEGPCSKAYPTMQNY